MKYIIEIENEPFGRNDDPFFPHGMDELYRAKGFKSLVFDQNGLDKLTPYTETDREAIEDEVWEFVRIITDMTEKQRIECFGGASCDLDEYWTYRDAKARYEKWRKKKDEIHEYDEIISEASDNKATIVRIDGWGRWHCINADGSFMVEINQQGCWRKTGRSFPELGDVLKKMREE